MITLVDTNVLLDVFLPDPVFGKRSAAALEKAFHEGSLIINEIIYAELSPQFDQRKLLDTVLERLGIRIISLNPEAAYFAGRIWKKYRQEGGTRARILSDFLIGAHSLSSADRLLSRDRGFYKRYFEGLKTLQV